MPQPPSHLTLREIAATYGYSIGTVRTWSLKRDDWPNASGLRRDTSSRGAPAHIYNSDDIFAWMQAYSARARPDDQWSITRVADELRVPRSAIQNRRKRGTLPPADGHTGHRPWWRPTTIRTWANTQLVPSDAWTIRQVAAYTGRRNPLNRHGPSPDGCAGRRRWWWPATIQTWWTSIQARLQTPPTSAYRPPATHPSPSPTRWFGRDVAAATGLSYDSVRTYRKIGRLPPPDGTTNSGRPWWYPPTIRAWDRPATTGRPRGSRRARVHRAS